MSIFFCNIPATGHMNPIAPVISELVRRGETVYYFNGEDQRKACEATGAMFVPYPPQADMDKLMANATNGNFADNALAFQGLQERYLPFLMAQIQQHQPRLMLFDSLATWGRMAAEMANIPNIASITTFVVSASTVPPTQMPSLVKMLFYFARATPKSLQINRRIKRQFPTAKTTSLLGALTGTGQKNIVFTSRSFQPNGDKLGKEYEFVGASIASRPPDTTFPFEQLTGKPLVYISLGTINNRRDDFYKLCFEAFGQHTGQFVLSVGKQTDITALGTIPANFVVKNFVPQLDVLQRADAFITHGGMNSVHEGLYYGVPLIVLPQQPEQAIVANRVQDTGAGVLLPDLTKDHLQGALAKVLASPTMKQAAQTIGDSLKAAGGYVRAADVVQGR
jgi:hypothetical protein